MNDSKVEIFHTFGARPELVWTALTDPRWMIKWYGSDPDGIGKRAETDLRVGGRFEVEFATSSGDLFVCMGEYEKIEPPQALYFTWRWRGREHWTERVAIELRGEAGNTIMRFVHADIDPSTIHGYSAGWQSTFKKLDAVLAAMGAI